MRILSARDVEAAVDVPAAIAVVGQALAEFSNGHTVVPERLPVAIADYGATMLAMPALAPRLGALGLKLVSVYPDNVRQGKRTINGLFILLDISTGEPLAMLEAASLTAMRTGAAAALSCRLLARPEASCVTVIGTGAQARSALRALLEVQPVREVRLHNRIPASAYAMAEAVAQWPQGAGLKVMVTLDPGAAVEGADILITATTSLTPVLPASAVGPGMHIVAIGAFRPNMQEVPSDVVARATKVVVESRSSALAEAGDLLIPIREHRFRPDQIHAELGEIFDGRRPGRQRPDELTLFKSVGHAVMDVAMARAIYDQALRRNLGQVADLGL